MQLQLVMVETLPCMFYGKRSYVNVPRDAYVKYISGEAIQTAWPYSSPEDREYLITGTHPWCWPKERWDE